jgi:hypothetical protein
VDDDHSSVAWTLDPGDDARIDRLVAEAVADDDQRVPRQKRFV